MSELRVFELKEGEIVGCYYCMEAGDHTDYKKGEAFFALADHPPWNGNGNYICRIHLDPEAITYYPLEQS